MKNENYCVVTGIMVEKGGNADNKDIKRPVIEVEICATQYGDISFERLPVLFSDPVLLKSASGLCVGEILTISGELKEDERCGLFVEADTLTREPRSSGRAKGLSVARANLLQRQQRFNFASVMGIAKENCTILVSRNSFSRGDLKKEDAIPVFLPENKELPAGKPVICIGALGFGEQGMSLCAERVYELASGDDRRLI